MKKISLNESWLYVILIYKCLLYFTKMDRNGEIRIFSKSISMKLKKMFLIKCSWIFLSLIHILHIFWLYLANLFVVNIRRKRLNSWKVRSFSVFKTVLMSRTAMLQYHLFLKSILFYEFVQLFYVYCKTDRIWFLSRRIG